MLISYSFTASSYLITLTTVDFSALTPMTYLTASHIVRINHQDFTWKQERSIKVLSFYLFWFMAVSVKYHTLLL